MLAKRALIAEEEAGKLLEFLFEILRIDRVASGNVCHAVFVRELHLELEELQKVSESLPLLLGQECLGGWVIEHTFDLKFQFFGPRNRCNFCEFRQILEPRLLIHYI